MELNQQILSDIVVYMKYSEYIPELHRRELWPEICGRYETMMAEKYPALKEEFHENMKYVLEKKILPSMRAMQFALDELLTNAIMHGKVSLNDPMQVDLIVAKSVLRAVISHAGPEFDPTEVAAPDLEGGLQDREIGGLGLFQNG